MDGIERTFSQKDMTFEEAVEYFKGRVPVTADVFYRIAEQYRGLAFTVSGYTKAQILKRFYDEILAALEDGNTFSEFRKNMNDFLKAEGYEGLDPLQADLIFRTNIQTAYNVGHYEQMTDPGVMKLRPEDDKVVANKEVCELLGLKAGAATADVAAAIMALKGGNIGGVNLVEQVKSLEAKLADRDAEEAVELALKAGKITPAQRDWAKGYALKSLDDFRGFVEKAPQVVPMGDVGGSSSLALKADEVDEATLLVCKQLGISPEDVKKYGMKGE